jgi:hypothetical protein
MGLLLCKFSITSMVALHCTEDTVVFASSIGIKKKYSVLNSTKLLLHLLDRLHVLLAVFRRGIATKRLGVTGGIQGQLLLPGKAGKVRSFRHHMAQIIVTGFVLPNSSMIWSSVVTCCVKLVCSHRFRSSSYFRFLAHDVGRATSVSKGGC